MTRMYQLQLDSLPLYTRTVYIFTVENGGTMKKRRDLSRKQFSASKAISTGPKNVPIYLNYSYRIRRYKKSGTIIVVPPRHYKIYHNNTLF